MLGISAIYLVPMILGPIIAAVTGWSTAYLQYRGQKSQTGISERTQIMTDLRTELTRVTGEVEKFRAELRTVRDVLIRMLGPAELVTPESVKAELRALIREGLHEL